MGDKTGIEWTDATWNPVVGCSKVSPGCDNCYAIGMSARIEAMAAGADRTTPYEGIVDDGDWTGLVRTVPERLDQPLRWKRPRRIFVNSMSDLFHPDVPTRFIDAVFKVMAQASHHQFQVLTKRPQRMREHFNRGQSPTYPSDNVWLGTSIELDKYLFRAEHLESTPAAVRFLSLEPLLGPLPSLTLDGINWIIVGGESGPKARPMHIEWVRDIRDQCVDAGVPFFFKQWGQFIWEKHIREPGKRDAFYKCRVAKKAAGRLLDGRTWDQYPKPRSR